MRADTPATRALRWAAYLAWAAAWAATPWISYFGGVAGFPMPHLTALYGAGLAALAWDGWTGRKDPSPVAQAAAWAGFVTGSIGALACLAMGAGGEPVIPSLLAMPLPLLLGATLGLRAAGLLRRTPFALACAVAAVLMAAAALDVFAGGRTSRPPHHVGESLAYAAAAVALAWSGPRRQAASVPVSPATAAS